MFGVYVPITPSDISRLRLKWGYITVDEHFKNVEFDAEHLARRWGDAESDAERKWGKHVHVCKGMFAKQHASDACVVSLSTPV